MSDPRAAESFHARGLEALRAKQYASAIEQLNKAIAHDPSVARYHVNRGEAFRSAGQFDQAIADYRRAIELQPDNAAAHYNLGLALKTLGKSEEAIASYRAAIRIKPDYAKAMYNLANTLRATGKLAEAEESYRAALSIDPGYVEAWNNLGELFEELRRVDESAAAVSRAIELRPAHAGAHFNRGFLQLLQGDYQRGWKEYEWRFQSSGVVGFPELPRWDGSDLSGKTIYLIGEQGVGDTIQFVRYASVLNARGARVIVRCQRAVAGLVGSVSGVAEVVAEDAPTPRADFYIPMLSVPGLMGTTLDTIPADIPYIAPEAKLVERWRERLKTHRRTLNVGLAWAGNPQQKNDRNRSAPLSALKPLIDLPDAAIFSLQKGLPGPHAVSANLIDLSQELNDFSDTAAAIANLDVVVSVCTSVAHVAGAMGKPTLAMLCFNADWRWLLDREDSPWYPTMKLFRQKFPGDWGDVAQRVRGELAARVCKLRQTNSAE